MSAIAKRIAQAFEEVTGEDRRVSADRFIRNDDYTLSVESIPDSRCHTAVATATAKGLLNVKWSATMRAGVRERQGQQV